MSLVKHDPSAETIVQSSIDDLAAKFFGPPPVAVQVEFGALSHQGKVRTNNEDHYAVVRRSRCRDVLHTNLPEGFLPPTQDFAYTLAVADGIGGAAFGELASMSALRTGWDLTGTAFKWHFKLTEQEFNELAEMVQVYVQLMHRNLKERALADPRLSGMGSTITAAMTFGLDALIAHAGDSRAYLFRRGTLKRLTRDHTVAQEMVDAGVIPSVAHASQIMQHMLVNCLGGRYRDQVEVDVSRVALENCDVLLLCTDGLTDMISEEELTDLLNRDQPPQEACQACVDLAMDHGGKDNITVVVARFDV